VAFNQDSKDSYIAAVCGPDIGCEEMENSRQIMSHKPDFGEVKAKLSRIPLFHNGFFLFRSPVSVRGGTPRFE
jgi:hypothetical protein